MLGLSTLAVGCAATRRPAGPSETPPAKTQPTAPKSKGCNSFDPTTPVLLANGATKPIRQIDSTRRAGSERATLTVPK